MLDSRYGILDAGCWMLDAGCRMPDLQRQSPVAAPQRPDCRSVTPDPDAGRCLAGALPASSIQYPVSNIEYPVSSIQHPLSSTPRRAFTLIELLVVIAVISLLAAMIFPVTGAVTRNRIRSRARGELEQIATAIEGYKSKLGHYPPDNPGNVFVSQLYFELMGTTLSNDASGAVYMTRNGDATIHNTSASFSAFLGAGTAVNGFVNATKPSGGDEARTAATFLVGLKSTQVAQAAGLPIDNPKILICSVPGPNNMLNPWRYNSSNPTNNPNSYDLWVDVVISGKTNRISNWSREALTVIKP